MTSSYCSSDVVSMDPTLTIPASLTYHIKNCSYLDVIYNTRTFSKIVLSNY